jgi:signal peptidase II
MREAPKAAWSRWLAIAGAVLLLDLATKAWITSAFRYGESREVTPFFNLVLVHNQGAAFSFLAEAGGWQRWFFTAIAVAISIVLLVVLRRPHNAWAGSGMALVLGGAIGNLVDRVRLGEVVDFVQVHAAGYYFPAFNVADSAITVGAVLLLMDSLRPASGAGLATEEKT